MVSEEKSIIEEMRKVFVTIEVFNLRLSPIEKIVYGFASLILVGVVTALITLVIKK